MRAAPSRRRGRADVMGIVRPRRRLPPPPPRRRGFSGGFLGDEDVAVKGNAVFLALLSFQLAARRRYGADRLRCGGARRDTLLGVQVRWGSTSLSHPEDKYGVASEKVRRSPAARQGSDFEPLGSQNQSRSLRRTIRALGVASGACAVARSSGTVVGALRRLFLRAARVRTCSTLPTTSRARARRGGIVARRSSVSAGATSSHGVRVRSRYGSAHAADAGCCERERAAAGMRGGDFSPGARRRHGSPTRGAKRTPATVPVHGGRWRDAAVVDARRRRPPPRRRLRGALRIARRRGPRLGRRRAAEKILKKWKLKSRPPARSARRADVSGRVHDVLPFPSPGDISPYKQEREVFDGHFNG